MEGKGKISAAGRAALILLLALLLAAASAVLYFSRDYTLIGGWVFPRDTAELDLRDLSVHGTAGLRRLRAPAFIDLRGSAVSPRQMEQLQSAFPTCDIRWDVPLGENRYDSRSETLRVTEEDLAELEDLDRFLWFEALRSVDARGANCYEQLAALEAAYPTVELRWDVALGALRVDHTVGGIILRGEDADYRELRERLAYFPELRWLSIRGRALSNEEKLALQEAYPELGFRWSVETVCDLWFPSDVKELSLAGYGGFKLEELPPLLPLFPELECVDLTGCGFSQEELLAFREEVPGVDVRWRFLLCGAGVCTTDTEIDLSNHLVEDVSVVEEALDLFPYLERVIMCDCGVSDEEMDALDARHEDVRFVWMVHFGGFWLRTDATTFIATTWPYGYTYLTNEELWPLQYCRDLIALDLGHMHYSDVSFLWSLPKLQYLILADTNITDISMCSQMEDLYYLEIFQTMVSDISPLLQCRNPRHLNISYCPIRDSYDLAAMPWLERLWASGVGFSYDTFQALTQNEGLSFYCAGGGATGGTWRTDPAYYEMRGVFGEYYMPG